MTVLPLSRRGLFGGAAAAAAGTLLAPRLAQAQATAPAFLPTAYDRMVGDVRVTTLLDGVFPLQQTLVTNLDPAAIAEGLRRAYLDPAGPVPLPVTVHVLRQGDQITVIDGGAGTAFGPSLGRLAPSLAAIGVAPESVNRLVVTHMHPDHIGGFVTEAGAAFPAATLHVSAADLAFWTDEGIAAGVPDSSKPFFALARAVAAAYGERVMPFEGDVDLGGGLSAIAMPGHTIGHTGYRLSSGNDQLILWGDMAAVAALQFTHPDSGIAFDSDGVQAAATRRKMLDMIVTDRIAVAGTHLPFPGFGHVEAKDGAYAWVPEEWKLL